MENKNFRLDHILIEKGLAESRTKAQYLIKSGNVKVNGQIITKPSKKCTDKDEIVLITDVKYVSRAGYKLEEFIKECPIDINEKVVCDIGSSTGGFVDYFLQNMAKKVYAVDVNVSQLHPRIALNERVIKIEKNARLLSKEDIQEDLDIITVDVSFISLEKLLNVFAQLSNDNTKLITLIKPQFETEETKSGIVTKKVIHVKVLENVLDAFEKFRFFPNYLTFSKVLGGDGNIEFFCLFSKRFTGNNEKKYTESDIIRVVDMAWEALK